MMPSIADDAPSITSDERYLLCAALVDAHMKKRGVRLLKDQAARFGLSRQAYSDLCRGKTVATLPTAIRISDETKLPIKRIFQRELERAA